MEDEDEDYSSHLYIETTAEVFPYTATYLELTSEVCVHNLPKEDVSWQYPGWDGVGLGYVVSKQTMLNIMNSWPSLPLDTYLTGRNAHDDLKLLVDNKS